MTRRSPKAPHLILKEQAANVLVSALHEFLRRHEISEKTIKTFTATNRAKNLRSYRRLMRACEYTGVLMGTWFSNPKFLDAVGNPIALAPGSIARLIRASRVPLTQRLALQLLRSSPSIKVKDDGSLVPLRKVLVLPDFEVPRAALVMERYLDTLHRNASLRKYNATLLERSCHATGIDLSGTAPILRDIKERGGAFMDAVDGEIEAHRSPWSKRKQEKVGELGVLVFAWARPNFLMQLSERSIKKVRRV